MSWRENTIMIDRIVMRVHGCYTFAWQVASIHLGLTRRRAAKLLIFDRRAWRDLKKLLREWDRWQHLTRQDQLTELRYYFFDHPDKISRLKDALAQEYFDY